jgi:hypothetical protein
MTYALPFLCLCLGSVVGCLLYGRAPRARIAQLEFDKEMLLDFNERLLRERELDRSEALSDDTPIYEGDEVEVAE